MPISIARFTQAVDVAQVGLDIEISQGRTLSWGEMMRQNRSGTMNRMQIRVGFLNTQPIRFCKAADEEGSRSIFWRISNGMLKF
jgi:hypothetical protein